MDYLNLILLTANAGLLFLVLVNFQGASDTCSHWTRLAQNRGGIVIVDYSAYSNSTTFVPDFQRLPNNVTLTVIK